MGIVSPKMPSDRFQHGYTNMHPDPEGNLGLRPTNFCWNWNFGDLDYDGDPEQFEIGVPEDPEGIIVYMSDINSGFETMAAQNATPIEISEDSYLLNEPYYEGHAPVIQNRQAPIAPPIQPEVKKIASSKNGYQAGSYWVAYSWFDGSESTKLSPAKKVTLLQGQFIRVSLPTSVPEDVDFIGIWLSKPQASPDPNVNTGLDTMRLQVKVNVRRTRPTSYLLTGPWKDGLGEKSKNETKPKSPKKPRVRKKRGRRRGRRGKARARVAEVRANGRETDTSEWSDQIELTQADVDAFVEVEVDFQGSVPADSELHYQVYVEFEDGETGEVTEYRLEDFALSNSPFTKPQKNRRGRRRRPQTGGVTAGQRRARRRQGGAMRDQPSATLDPTTTAAPVDEGVEDPSDALESVLAEGAALIQSPGTYKIALSYWVRGQETALSPIVSVTLLAGETIRVYFPDEVNMFRNSQWIDLDADGVPDGWVLSGVSGGGTQGTFRIDPDSSLVLDSLGDRISGQATPQMYQEVTINRSSFYVIGGVMTATVTSGYIEAVVEELNDANAVVTTHTLRQLSSSGIGNFEKILGAGFTEFQAATVAVRVMIRFGPSASTRNGIVRIAELYMHPHDRPLRRREKKHKRHKHHRDRGHKRRKHDREHSKPNNRNNIRWEKGGYQLGVEEPPQLVARASAITGSMSPVTFDSGVLPTPDWTLANTNPGGVTSSVLTTSKIDGTYGWRVQKSTSSSAYVALHRAFDGNPNRDRLAIRAKFRVVSRPTKGNVHVLAIQHVATTGSYVQDLVWIEIQSDGEIYLQDQDLGGDLDSYYLGSCIAGDVLDLELRVWNIPNTNASCDAALGKNGATRVFTPIQSVNLSGSRRANVAIVGPYRMSDTASLFTFDIDSIVPSNSGDFSTGSGAPPPLLPYPLPDRPLRDPVHYQYVDFENQKNIATLNQSTAAEGTIGVGGYGGTSVTRSSEDQWEGNYSFRVDDRSLASNLTTGITIGHTGMKQLATGTNVVCSAYVLMPENVTFHVAGRPSTTGGGYISEGQGSQTFVGTGDWQRVETLVWSLSGQTYLPGFQITVPPGEDGVVFFVDGIQVEEKTTAGATAFEPGVGNSIFYGYGWTTWRSPSDSTTVTSVQTAAAIEGARGLRLSDSATGSSSWAYFERDLSTSDVRASLGFKARMRVVALPSTGSLSVMGLWSASSTTMVRVTLNAAGELHGSCTNKNAVVTTPVKIADGITANTVLTMEIVASGAGTSAGSCSFWVSKAGSGTPAERNLMHQETAIDWSSTNFMLRYTAIGGYSESAANVTFTFDVDQIRLTETGEVLFDEYTADGRPIYQVHMWFPPGQPVRQDLYLKGWRWPVEPGQKYTAAIRARHAGVVGTAYPYFFTAYDSDGRAYPLGSLYSSGATGSQGWTNLQRTFTIPSVQNGQTDAHEIVMHSKDIGQGEFVCQSFAFCYGDTAVREVRYPTEGTCRVVLDTRTPEQLTNSTTNRWLDMHCIVDEPPGTSSNVSFGSSANTVVPDSWHTDSSLVQTNRFAHFDVTLYSNADRTVTPMLVDESPYVDYYRSRGDQQVHTLLRYDLSEFPAGVTLSGVHFPRELSTWDVFAPKGRLQRHRRWEPVGQLPPFKITVFSEQTLAEIEQQCLADDFVIETRDRRLQIRFGSQVVFVVKPESPRKVDGKWYLVAEAEVETVEVLNVDPMVGLREEIAS